MEKGELEKLQKLLTKMESRRERTGDKNVELSMADIYLLEGVYRLDFTPARALVGLDEKQYNAITNGFLRVCDDFKAKNPSWKRPSGIKTWEEHLKWEDKYGKAISGEEKKPEKSKDKKEGGRKNEGKGKS